MKKLYTICTSIYLTLSFSVIHAASTVPLPAEKTSGFASAAAATTVTPPTLTTENIAALKAFALDNLIKGGDPVYLTVLDTCFPLFEKPFVTRYGGRSRIPEYSDKRTALENLYPIVHTMFQAFTDFFRHNATDTKTTELGTITFASRAKALERYHAMGSRHFLVFQQMVNALLAHKAKSDPEITSMLANGYGAHSELGIIGIADTVGIVPIPTQPSTGKAVPGSIQLPIPYGTWGDDLQRSVSIVNGEIVTAPHVYISILAGGVVKMTLQNLKGPFITSPQSVRISAESPTAKHFIRNNILQINAETETISGVLILPQTDADALEFEATFLENLVEEAASDDELATALLAQYEATTPRLALLDEEAALLEDVATGGAEEGGEEEKGDDEGAATTTVTHPLLKHTEALFYLAAEQAAAIAPEPEAASKSAHQKASKATAKGKGKGKKGKGKKNTKAQAKSAPKTRSKAAAVAATTAPMAATKETLLSQLKTKGREKWRNLNKVIMGALREAYRNGNLSLGSRRGGGGGGGPRGGGGPQSLADGTALTVNVKGSHYNLHFTDLSTGLTVVRPHGGKDATTLPASKARSLVSNLVDLLFQSLQPKA